MDCLRDYILISWCGNTTAPLSGLYINSLPGISFQSLQGIADPEQLTFRNAWEDVQTRALKRLELDLRQLFSATFKLKNLTQSSNLGWDVDRTKPITLDTSHFYGFEVDLSCDPTGEFMESALFEIYLQHLYVYSSVASVSNNITVKIFEGDTKNCIYSETVTKTLGNNSWNKVEVNFNFIQHRQANNFEILNNSQWYIVTMQFSKPVQSFELVNLMNDFCACCGFKTRAVSVTSLDDLFETSGTAYNLISPALNYEDNLQGVSAIINSRCSWSRLVCSNKDVFATSLWYLLGIETMNEQLNSDRFTRYTTIDLKRAEKLKQEYEIAYMGGTKRDALGFVIQTIKGSLTQAVESISLDCDCCLECEGELSIQESVL